MSAPLIDEVLLTEEFAENMTGGPGFMTVIVKTGSGTEQRNIRWDEPLGHWTLNVEGRSPAQAAKLVSFFMARRGSGKGFRLKLPAVDDHTVATPTPTVPIDARRFQLVKRYVDDANYELVKTIYKPVDGTVAIFHGSTPVVGWSCDPTTGIVTFGSAPGYVPAATFEFHVPVRLRADQMQRNYQNFLAIGWQNIELDELRGRPVTP